MVDNKIFIALAVYGIHAAPTESPEVRLPTLLGSRRSTDKIMPIKEVVEIKNSVVEISNTLPEESLIKLPGIEKKWKKPPSIQVEIQNTDEIKITDGQEEMLTDLAKEMMYAFFNVDQNINEITVKNFIRFCADEYSVLGDVRKELEIKFRSAPDSVEKIKSLISELKKNWSQKLEERLLDILHSKCRVSPWAKKKLSNFSEHNFHKI